MVLQIALLIGEKCAVLAAEDLGYSGSGLDMTNILTQVGTPIWYFIDIRRRLKCSGVMVDGRGLWKQQQ